METYCFNILKKKAMKKTLKVSIQQPCSEKFNSFKKTELGGFCNSCSKEVIDFTNKTDKEVLDYFKTKSESTCGYFNKNQLKTYHEPRDHRELKKYRLFSAFSFSLISLFTTNTVTAQKNTTNTVITETDSILKKKPIITDITLKGIVYSLEDDLPLPGASIVLKNSVFGTETDFDGKFELKNIKEGDIVSIYFIGFQTQEIVIKKDQKNIEIYLKEDDSMLLGGAMLTGKVDVKATYKTKRTLKQRIKSIF